MKKTFLFITAAIVTSFFLSCTKKNSTINPEDPENPQPEVKGESCGPKLYWTYDEQTFTLDITGEGMMFDYDTVGPWGKPAEILGYYQDGAMKGEPIYRYRKIKFINLPEGITHVGENAFDADITFITIPSTVTSIGKHAFLSCYNIQYVKSLAVIPPTYGTWCFSHEAGTPYSHIPVYVPSQSVAAYTSAIGWQAHPIQAIP